MGCCISVKKEALYSNWQSCTSNNCRCNIVIDMIAYDILAVNSGSVKSINRKEGLIYKGKYVYQVVISDDLRTIRHLRSGEYQIVLITKLFYHQVISFVDISVAVFDYYQIEQLLSR